MIFNLILFAILTIVLYYCFPLLKSTFNGSDYEKVQWKKIFNIKDLHSDYVPQGIEAYDNYILFTVHKKDTKSVLIVFKKDVNKLKYLYEIDMPSEAMHTSDLCIYDNILYAIDYHSNIIYQIDLNALLQERKLIIKSKFFLNMKRTGSLVIVEYNNEKYILFTQFIISDKLHVIKLSDLKNGSLEKDKIQFSIKNNSLVQGLFRKNNNLYISVNRYGIDLIYVVDIQKMMKEKGIQNAILKTINAPSKMVEDIVVYKDKIIISDEGTNYIYESYDKY